MWMHFLNLERGFAIVVVCMCVCVCVVCMFTYMRYVKI